jgi:hypothetical protein
MMVNIGDGTPTLLLEFIPPAFETAVQLVEAILCCFDIGR